MGVNVKLESGLCEIDVIKFHEFSRTFLSVKLKYGLKLSINEG